MLQIAWTSFVIRYFVRDVILKNGRGLLYIFRDFSQIVSNEKTEYEKSPFGQAL